MGAGTQAGPRATTAEDLHHKAAAGTRGAAEPGAEQHGFVAHTHGGRPGAGGVPARSRAERLASFDVADFPIPTGREEDWRFTPLDRLRGLHAGAAESGPAPAVEVEAPPGFTAETVALTGEQRDDRLGRTGPPEDRISAQAWTSAATATLVTLEKSAVAEQPAVVRVSGHGGTHYLHLALRAARQSTGVVVLDHRGSGAVAANVEIDVEDAAHLTVISIQDWADDAVHVTAHLARLGRDARLKHVVATLGGDLVRLTSSSRFTAPGSEIEALGLYFADAGQHQEHRLFVDHAVANCTSRVTYKGALQGDGAHTVWVGDVLIRAEAEGTDTYELNRNLVLTDGARADSVPNLEIETGEIVGAGHASATGRFDDEQLFYLQARGIPELEARRLVVRGFFVELIGRIGVPAVEERLMAAIEAELATSVGEVTP
ncbi:MAG TPA: Fe-S cluster assembly protein SufD [Kineosporiaceae bacterium]|nr:Fe-S cluster assembly protein SufD [Kineosporiaceae bacterium]